MPSTTLRISTRSIIQTVLLVAVGVVVFAVAARATNTLWWFVQAAVFAALATPVVRRWSRHMPTFLAVLALTALVAAAFGAVVAVGLRELQQESTRFRSSVPPAVKELESSPGLGRVVEKLKISDDLQDFADAVDDRLRFKGADLPGLASKVGGGVSATFVVWILTVMLAFSGPSMVNGLLSAAPERSRERVRWVLVESYRRSVSYIGWTALRAAAVLVVTFFVADLANVEMPGLLAVLAALCAFIPYVGVLAGGLPLVLMSLLVGPGTALAMFAGVCALQFVDVRVVQPRIDRASMTLGLFPTLVAAMIGFSLRGPGGLIVAVAIAAMVVAVVDDTGSVRALRDAALGSPDSPVDDAAAPAPPS